METARSLNGRLAQLEERAQGRHIRAVAGQLGAQVGCVPEELLQRAEAIGKLIEQHGRERTIELVAVGVGVTAEQLEDRANRLAASVA